MDAGCGYGYGSEILAERDTSVIGVDISPEAIEYANKHYNRRNITFHQGDITYFEFSEFGQFDAITFFEVLEHVSKPSATLQNLRKALKDSGKLIISVPNAKNASKNNEHHINSYAPEDLEELLISNGFEVKQKFGQYPLLGALAEIARTFTGYNSCTDKESGRVPRIVDSIPGLPEIFSNLYESDFAVSTGRTTYFVAGPEEKQVP
ncbi:MAG: class I SAM-dependent methyltransferase [DPANN group archaeon]|nr:class I SAM-dependent methyltransferase [DPANN group archaeon]